jgi:hypothetical protein
VERVCRVKRFTRGVEKFFQGYSKVTDDALPGSKVAEITDKRLLCCGFRRTGKTIRQVYRCWWRICRDMHSLLSNITYFTFYMHL